MHTAPTPRATPPRARPARGPARLLVRLLAAALWIAARAGAEDAPIRFEEVTAATGIGFVHDDGSSGRRYMPEIVSAGLATFDFDRDGRIDVWFPNGTDLPGTEPPRRPRRMLSRNLGGWRFADATEPAGLGAEAYGVGVTAGDYDGDGFPDVYESALGPKRLWRNMGDGTFAEVTAAAGVADGDKLGAGVAMLDADGDGDLDLYAANYVRFSYEGHVSPRVRGVPIYNGPRAYEAWPDTLFRNEGDGTFADVGEASGISAMAAPGMGVVCLDADDDGDTDVFVLDDVAANLLFRNDGAGRFEEVALEAGVAYDAFGQANGGMGVDCGDVDNDGRLDLWTTTSQGQRPILFRNLGGLSFEDATARSGAAAGSIPWVKWGAGIVDFDSDGRRDLFVACGHFNDLVDLQGDASAYRNHNIVLRNAGGRFENVSAAAGLEAVAKHSARGASFDDLDGDGDVDAVILNSREGPTVLRNLDRERGGANHWLGVRLVAVTGNRDGVGARVRVRAGDAILVDEVHSGRGYQGHYGSRLHFGLGDAGHVDAVEVRWIGGPEERFEVGPADRDVMLRQGEGRPVGR
ncbi:MAG: CRTAC1 family protein [Planctomycetaceae bacterium]